MLLRISTPSIPGKIFPLKNSVMIYPASTKIADQVVKIKAINNPMLIRSGPIARPASFASRVNKVQIPLAISILLEKIPSKFSKNFIYFFNNEEIR